MVHQEGSHCECEDGAYEEKKEAMERGDAGGLLEGEVE